jgi:hypothetical protein
MSGILSEPAAEPTATEPTTTEPTATPPSTEPAVTPPTSSTTDWQALRDTLPEDIRNDSTFTPITSLEGLAKSFVHAQKAIGRDRIPLPDKHATEQDWQNTFKKLGLPESVEDYQINLGEGKELSDEFSKNFKEQAHKAGILPFQAEKLAGWYADYTQSFLEAQKTQTESSITENTEALKKEWGDAYDDNVTRAKVAFKELIPDQADRDRLLDMGLGNDPGFIKALTKASKFFSEDTFVGAGAGQFTSMSPDDALQKARQIQGDAQHPYRNRQHPNHEAAKKEVADLYKIAYPE